MSKVRRQRRPYVVDVLVRLFRTKPLGAAGLVICVSLLVVAIFADWIAPEWYNELAVKRRLQPPSAVHLMGTDALGRDLYSRMVYGTRISVYVGFGAVALGVVVGYIIGVPGAYYGGWLDQLLQRVVDAWIAIPGLVLLLTFSMILPPGILTIIVVIGTGMGISNARVIRGHVLSVQENLYVQAARGIGASNLRIMFRHILANTFAPVLILATGQVGTAITIESSLSFLGLGIPDPFPSWGGMIGGETRFYMMQAPWLSIYPGLALTAVIFGWMVLGDALRDLLDPRLRRG